MEAAVNTSMSSEMIYECLDDERKHIADEFILFLYHQQEEGYQETLRTVRSALNGEDIFGSFDSVEEMVDALKRKLEPTNRFKKTTRLFKNSQSLISKYLMRL